MKVHVVTCLLQFKTAQSHWQQTYSIQLCFKVYFQYAERSSAVMWWCCVACSYEVSFVTVW